MEMNEANWWIRFLRARKRSDRVKMELLFLLAGLWFMGCSVFHGAMFYRESGMLTEYVLCGNMSGELWNAKAAEFGNRKEIIAAGMQNETTVRLEFLWESMEFECTELTEGYLRAVYGISENGSMTVFYVNQAALEQIKQSWEKNSGKTFELNTFYPEYTLDGSGTGTARIVLLPEWVQEDIPYVCRKADSTRLNDSEQVRICLKKRDFDDGITKWLGSLGLEPEDSRKKQIEDLENENSFLRIKYEILAVILCFTSAVCLQKYGRKD